MLLFGEFLCISNDIIEGCGFRGAGTAVLGNGKKGKLYFPDRQMGVLAPRLDMRLKMSQDKID